jgi:hypothetical protein
MVIAATAEIVVIAAIVAIVATAAIAETEAIVVTAASVRRSLRPSPQRKLRLPIRRQPPRERQVALDVLDNQRSTCPAQTG